MKAVVYSALFGFVAATPSLEVMAKFEQFRHKWSRAFEGEEYTIRAKYFEDNLRRVEYMQQMERGTAIYSHLGPFADYSPEEMSQRMGFVPTSDWENIPAAQYLNVPLFSSYDWREWGAVNAIKDQGQCGSCAAFSAVCNLEGAIAKDVGELVDLSEQHFLDCGEGSCQEGGSMSSYLEWSSENGGIATQTMYPYVAADQGCLDKPKVAHNTGFLRISTSENQIAMALLTYGPLAIAINASPFGFYGGGIFDQAACDRNWLNHGMNIVAYGSGDGMPYWTIRNSWGSAWGEGGYMRITRGSCMCGLCRMVGTATGVSLTA